LGKVKVKIFTVAVIALLLTLMSQATLAYYSTVGAASNVVTSGSIRLKIHEKTEQGTEYPKGGVYVAPGDVVSKEVSIENDCDHPFYLRVKLIYGINSEALSAEECLRLNINGEFWEEYDGWYYFKGIVTPGHTTPNVFSHVEIVGDKADNDYLGKTLSLTVTAQAVQSENNPITDGKFYTALGWPKE